MTRQAYDSFSVEGRPYALSAFTGRGIFVPEDFGLEPVMLHTGCGRGFQCSYAVDGGQLYLDHLVIGVAEPARLLGAMPIPNEGAPWQIYVALPEPVPFTGGILAGQRRRDIPLAPCEDSAVLGQLPFHLFDGLQEFRFQAGTLVAAIDRSIAAATLVERSRVEGRAPPASEIRAWLGSEFAESGYVNYEAWLYGDA